MNIFIIMFCCIVFGIIFVSSLIDEWIYQKELKKLKKEEEHDEKIRFFKK